MGRDAVGKEGSELHDGDRTSKRSNDDHLSKEGHFDNKNYQRKVIEAVENEQGDNTVSAARLL